VSQGQSGVVYEREGPTLVNKSIGRDARSVPSVRKQSARFKTKVKLTWQQEVARLLSGCRPGDYDQGNRLAIQLQCLFDAIDSILEGRDPEQQLKIVQRAAQDPGAVRGHQRFATRVMRALEKGKAAEVWEPVHSALCNFFVSSPEYEAAVAAWHKRLRGDALTPHSKRKDRRYDERKSRQAS